MLTLEEARLELFAAADKLPGGLYASLNGGILLLPDCKLHPKARRGNLLIEGEYHYDPRGLGRYITIYYGSLLKTCAHLSDDAMRQRLHAVLHHELTHHIESLSGDRTLEREDARRVRGYLEGGGAHEA